MNELLLVVTIAGERVAFPAAAVEAVVELDTLIPVPRAAPHVAGLSALRSRVLTVIDCVRSLELGDTDCSDGIREAAVVELEGHHYALIVDLVEDVVEALSDTTPVRAAMERGWVASVRASASSTVRMMSRKRIRRARKEATASSLAALSTTGEAPPASSASRATRNAGNRSRSGASKDREPICARSSLSTGVSIRSGQANVWAIGIRMSGLPS